MKSRQNTPSLTLRGGFFGAFAIFGVYDPVLGQKITVFDDFRTFFDIFGFELVPAGASLWKVQYLTKPKIKQNLTLKSLKNQSRNAVKNSEKANQNPIHSACTVYKIRKQH